MRAGARAFRVRACARVRCGIIMRCHMLKYFIVFKEGFPYTLVIADSNDLAVLLDHGFIIYPISRMTVDDLVFEESDFNA